MLGSLNTRVMLEYLPEIWEGFLATLLLSAAGFAGAMVLGVIACALSIQPLRWLRWPAVAYVDAVRAPPLLAQLYFLYFGLPRLGIVLPEMLIGVIALSLNSGAYVAEIIRSGILSIQRGQVEAAMSSGMSYLQRMRLVILPQALRPTVSPLIGQALVSHSRSCRPIAIRRAPRPSSISRTTSPPRISASRCVRACARSSMSSATPPTAWRPTRARCRTSTA